MLDIKKLHINRTLLVELKQMRECMHENLIKIIGVCIEAPNYCIVSELCPRGTLFDLLQNEKMNIDWVSSVPVKMKLQESSPHSKFTLFLSI